jgi:hypothetical protein
VAGLDGVVPFEPSISTRGRFIAFGHTPDLGDSFDILLYDRAENALVPLPGFPVAGDQLSPSIR